MKSKRFTPTDLPVRDQAATIRKLRRRVSRELENLGPAIDRAELILAEEFADRGLTAEFGTVNRTMIQAMACAIVRLRA